MTHTNKQLRELDAWIAEHVMGWKRMTWHQHFKTRGLPNGKELTSYWHNKDGSIAADFCGECDCGKVDTSFKPTTDPAASDALDDAILKKCELYVVDFDEGVFRMNAGKAAAEHPDKKICRALFARQLFKEKE